MTRIKIAIAALLLSGATPVAFADNDFAKVAMPAGSLSTAQITERLQSQGYAVRKIELDDGAYKVKATDASHHKAKLMVNPSTGAVLSSKLDDDD